MEIVKCVKGKGPWKRIEYKFTPDEKDLKAHTMKEWKNIIDSVMSEAEEKALKEIIEKIDNDMLHGGIYDGPIDNVPATEVFGNDFDPSKIGGII